jgi:type IV secretory pathway TrbL component
MCNGIHIELWYTSAMKKLTILLMMTIVLMSGCTQIVTAPIKIAGAAVSTTIDIAGSATHAVVGSDGDEKED